MWFWLFYLGGVALCLHWLEMAPPLWLAFIYVGAFELFARELLNAPVTDEFDDDVG